LTKKMLRLQVIKRRLESVVSSQQLLSKDPTLLHILTSIALEETHTPLYSLNTDI